MADHSILDPSIGFLVVTDDGLIQTPLKNDSFVVADNQTGYLFTLHTKVYFIF